MKKDLCEIERMAHLKEEENQSFMIFLKGCDHFKVDKIVHKLNEKYLSLYDCTKCGNCCKQLAPSLSQEEILEITDFLNITYEDFIEKFVNRETTNGFILKNQECPFLNKNKCSIYEYRPEACRSFPHLHKDNINHRLLSLLDNIHICPIIYYIFEDLKEIFKYTPEKTT